MIKRASTCFAAMLLATLLLPAQAAQWHTELVLGYESTTCSIDVGADGTPHLAFFPKPGAELHYGRRDPLSGWSDEIITARRATEQSDLILRLDAGGKAHIAYPDSGAYPPAFNVAENLQGPWTVDLVAQRQPLSMSMSLYAQVEPFIAYMDVADQLSMHVALRQQGTGWITPKVTNHRVCGTAVAIDAGGAAHVVYLDVDERTVKYARLAQGRWTFETIEAADAVCASISIALDNAGRPTAAYTVKDRIRIAERGDAAWQVSALPEVAGVSLSNPVVQLDARNNPHIAYIRSNPETVYPFELRYATRRPFSGWVLEEVDEYALPDHAVSFVLDRNGVPHIAYHSLEGLNTLKYATKRPPVVTTP